MSSEDNALEGLTALVSEDLLTAPEVANVLSLFLGRIDYTTIGVEALEADRHGQLEVYRSRLSEAYRYLPVLAFVPRAVWPDKPLFDYGRELYIALTGMDTNAITPSGVVASYLWLGYPGVLVNAILLSYLFVCSGRLLTTSLHDPLAYLPVLLPVILIWTPESIVMSRYVIILRAFVAVGLFYLMAGQLGLLRKVGRALPRQESSPAATETGLHEAATACPRSLHKMMSGLPPLTRNAEQVATLSTCTLTAHQHFALFACCSWAKLGKGRRRGPCERRWSRFKLLQSAKSIQVTIFRPIAPSSCVERTACYVRCNVRSWSTGSLNFSECCLPTSSLHTRAGVSAGAWSGG